LSAFTSTHSLTLASPAKLNLSLHIIQRLASGYHQLQSVMQLIDLHDSISFNATADNKVSFACDLPAINNPDNLVVKAANTLKSYAQRNSGVAISLKKNIPLQAGLGGGSSNAASCLLALNYLWQLNLSTPKLATIALQLGADVPFFIYGKNALVGGIGEQIETELDLAPKWFLIIQPSCAIATSSLFNSSLLQFSKPATPAQILADTPYNDCAAAAIDAYPPLALAMDELAQYSSAYMTGTGSCIFSQFTTREQAQKIADKLSHYRHFVVRGITQSPVHTQLSDL
jgi:4-diphosphocytidyl-2-C-methyl-D-erythritol kinase